MADADSTDFDGEYTFGDTETGDLWATAVGLGGGDTIPAGGYRTTDAGSSTFTAMDVVELQKRLPKLKITNMRLP